MITEKTIYITEQGIAHLEEELLHLKTVKRPLIIEQMHDAKDMGDWGDNSEYMLFENELAFADGRIQQLDDMLRNAIIIEPGNADNIVDIGETVLIQLNDGELEQYRIVGVAETDPGQGLISNESPLGKALLGHKVGDEVVFSAPDGKHCYRIVAVT